MFTNKDIEDEITNDYTLEYFISKFEAISEELFISDFLIGQKDDNQHCALGHCNMIDYNNPTTEAIELVKLFGGNIDFEYNHLDTDYKKVYVVNDLGEGTPKERILNYLYQIRDNQIKDNQSCIQ